MKAEYLAGLFDGEGSLIIRFRKDSRYKNGFQIKPHIDIAQKNPQVLKMIQKEFNMGKVYKNTDDVWHFCLFKFDDLVKLLEMIENHSIIKKEKMKKFLICVKMMQKKNHLHSDGFEKIKKIWSARDSEANTP